MKFVTSAPRFSVYALEGAAGFGGALTAAERTTMRDSLDTATLVNVSSDITATGADDGDLTAKCKGLEVNLDIDQHDVQSSENRGFAAMLPGTTTAAGTATFTQDYTDVHPVLNRIVENKGEYVFEFAREFEDVAGSGDPGTVDNPLFRFLGVIATYNPISTNINTPGEVSVDISPGPTFFGIREYSA